MPSVETIERATGTRYRVRVRDPRPVRGKVGYTSATFATQAEAERFCRDCDDRGIEWALAEYRRENAVDELTLDEWAEKHFASLTEASGASIRKYRTIYASAWSPALGHLPLSTITRTHVATALNGIGGSDKTRQNKWGVLTHIFKTAMQEGLIARSPTVGVKVGRRTDHHREEHRYLTRDEFVALVEATPEHWRPLVLTLGGTGMRWGEAVALNVGDVDFEAGAVRVTKALKAHPDIPNEYVVGPTKSRRSRRTVTLPRMLLDVLAPLCEGRRADELLFTAPMGGPVKHRTFYSDIWKKKSVQPLKLPHPRIHDLRHSHVAWLIAENVPMPVIQARLGHEKITTTIDTYGHLMPDLQVAAAHAANVALAGVVVNTVRAELAE